VFRGLVGVDDLVGAGDDVDGHAGLSLARGGAGAFELHVTPFADPGPGGGDDGDD
jgi:hypothetical protein